MQTFLPYESYQESAACLDNKRLGNQRVKVYQILKALTDPTYGWQNHPAVNMWRGCGLGLIIYGLKVCDEWIKRGFRDSCKDKIAGFIELPFGTHIPTWLGDEQFHLSHQSNLIRKLPSHYRPIFGSVPDNLPYVWPKTTGEQR